MSEQEKPKPWFAAEISLCPSCKQPLTLVEKVVQNDVEFFYEDGKQKIRPHASTCKRRVA